MTPMRRQLIQDLTIRGYSPHTIRNYVFYVYDLARYYRLPPQDLSEAQIQSFLFYLATERKVSWSTLNVAVSALRFFYHLTLKRPRSEVDLTIPRPRSGHRLPIALDTQEVQALFEVTTNLKHRALLMTVYSAGLRVSEVVALKPSHIDSSRQQIRVEQGKGRKDRYTLLSPRLLTELKAYWLHYLPGLWLFPGQSKNKPLTTGAAASIYNKWARKAGIKKRGSIHLLRHSFASHLLDNGMDLTVIQQLLGHRNLCTTATYLHLTRNQKKQWVSPLDLLPSTLPGDFDSKG